MDKLLNTGLRYLVVSLLAIVLDQVTKIWILNNLALYQDINVLPFFDITHVHNHGAAFSFLSNAGGWQRYFFTAIAVIVSVLLTYWLYKTPMRQKPLLWAYALILGGAIGNVADRINYGFVVDFLHFYYQSWSFPAFNVADIAISIGAALLLLDAFLEYRREKREKQIKSDDQADSQTNS